MLRLKGGPGAVDVSLTDAETGADVLRSIRARELRLVIGAGKPPRLEFAPSVEYDYEVPGAVRCLIGCPETGERREVAEIVFTDGGRISFPRDFSSAAGAEQVEEALPKRTTDTGE